MWNTCVFVFGLYTYLFSKSVKCGLHRRWSVGWPEQMVEVMISSAPLLCRVVVLWFGSLGHFGGCSISSGKVWCSVVIYDMVTWYSVKSVIDRHTVRQYTWFENM